MKLGKLAPKHDKRTALFRDFLIPAALPPVEAFDWAANLPADVGMMANDRIGLCTVAGIAHLIQVWTVNTDVEITISDDDVIATYTAITLAVNGRGYDPNDPTTDAGLALLDVLTYVRANGIGPQRHGKGLAFVKLNHDDSSEVRSAGQMFGGLYTGADMPISAESQVGEEWILVPAGPDAESGGWGGHCMALPTANTSGVSYLTWGKRQVANWDWVAAYADEMYAIVAPEWVSGEKPAPSGFDIVKLQAYLGAL